MAESQVIIGLSFCTYDVAVLLLQSLPKVLGTPIEYWNQMVVIISGSVFVETNTG